MWVRIKRRTKGDKSTCIVCKKKIIAGKELWRHRLNYPNHSKGGLVAINVITKGKHYHYNDIKGFEWIYEIEE